MAIEVDSTVPFTFNPRKLQFFDVSTGANLAVPAAPGAAGSGS
jgi:hypothetical protein